MGEGEATWQKRKKKPKPNHVESGVAPSQSPHASKPLPSAPSLQTPTQSPAPGTPILEEAAAEAAMRERKIRKEQKVAALLLARSPTFDEEEEQGEAAVLATKKKHKERKSSPSLSAAETPILEQEAKVTKKRKPRKEPSGNSPLPLDPGQTQSQGTNAPHASKPLHAAPFLEVPAQCPAPGTSMLEEVAAEAAMRKWKMRKEQKVAALPLAQNPSLDEEEQRVDAVLATKKKKKHKERNKSSLSPPAAAAAETPILEQEAKATKKRKWSKEQEPSCYLPLPVDPGQTQPQRTNAPHASKPLYAAPFIEAPAQSPAPGTPMLEEVAVEAAMMKRKMCKEQKVAALPLAQNPSLEEQAQERALVTKKKKHKERKSSPSPSAAAASETPILEQEAEVTKKRKQSKEQEPSGYSTLPLNPGQTQPQGTNAPHASKPLCAAPFIEAPAQSPAPGTPMLEEAAGEVVRKRKICKEQKVAAPSLAQSTTLEEQMEDSTAAKMKESKHMKHTLSSPSTSVAAETIIWEQEAKVNKKQKQRKQQEPSGESPLPLDPRQTQPHGTNAPHASKPLPAAPFLEAPAQSPFPGAPMVEEAASVVMRKRKICKEQKVAALSLAQNTTLEEQREDAMMAKMKKDSKYMELTLSSPSTSAAAETTIWEQEAKVTKKQKQRKQQEPYGKSTLPLHPGQVHCVRSQGGKAPLEQEREADGRTGSSIKKNNGKRPRVRVLSKRELIKEASKKQPALPEGFVAFSDFVPSCTGQNPDHSPPYVAFFDQFRYNPVHGDHKPPLPRTPDRLSRLPPRGYPSFELSELSANGTSKPSKANNSVARKSKKKDSGSGSASGSQEKLHAKEKKSPEKKMRTKKQREPPPLLTRAEKCSDKYRRVPLDQLVPPARSPHNLLQEKYASDPWKVIVICMLLNLTQGKQVKNIIEGFFKCYPDPQSACNADPDKMAGYLAYLGLQRVKTTRIQRFSKEYVEKEWTYITELCGVGKYAADAYAIFCAGRATEVVPQDHKLVDYWKYVCFELPMMQESQNTQEAGVLEEELAVIC